MARREADLALRTVLPERGDLVVTRLLTVGWRVAAAPELAREAGTLKRLADIPWVGVTERLAGSTPGRWARKHLGDLELVLRSDSLTVQVSAVRNGTGAALLPDRSIAYFGLSPVKLARPLQYKLGTWPADDVYLVTHQALRAVPRVRAVWAFLLEHAAGGGRR
jgi:DNA-binding transcriptional LysR family regulator